MMAVQYVLSFSSLDNRKCKIFVPEQKDIYLFLSNILSNLFVKMYIAISVLVQFVLNFKIKYLLSNFVMIFFAHSFNNFKFKFILFTLLGQYSTF